MLKLTVVSALLSLGFAWPAGADELGYIRQGLQPVHPYKHPIEIHILDERPRVIDFRTPIEQGSMLPVEPPLMVNTHLAVGSGDRGGMQQPLYTSPILAPSRFDSNITPQRALGLPDGTNSGRLSSSRPQTMVAPNRVEEKRKEIAVNSQRPTVRHEPPPARPTVRVYENGSNGYLSGRAMVANTDVSARLMHEKKSSNDQQYVPEHPTAIRF